LPDARQELERALGLHQQGQLRAAEKAYLAVLGLDPRQFEAMHGLGVLYMQNGSIERSEMQLRLALQFDPDNVAANHDHGVTLRSLGRFADAVASFDKSIAKAPGNALAHFNRATALLSSDRTDEAIAGFGRAILLEAGFAVAYCQRGNALLQVGRARDALDDFDQAIALNPNFAEAILNRANTLRELDRTEEAVPAYRKATALRPDHPQAYHNLGLALQDLGRFDEASASYNRAIFVQPRFHESIKARGTLELLLGKMQQGFSDFEHRLRPEDLSAHPALRAIPAWSGEGLAGKSIVVYSDGSMGDLVQFCRYLPRLLAVTADVALLAPARFHKILAMESIGVRSLSSLASGDKFDVRCELMSLPFLFKTDIDTVPRVITHLMPDASLLAKWRARLPRDTFNVGICWQGNPTRDIDHGRSVPLSQFRPLMQIPGVRFFSLQKDHGVEQLQELPESMRVESFGPEFDGDGDAFMDTAAIMTSLDLIVTSDTAVAHLAAALGRPTWVALKYVPEWRWLLNRADSPWYPAVRLFRQSAPGQWAPVFTEIANALGEILGGRSTAH